MLSLNKILKTKKINLGIEILRMLLCFWVLSFHFLEKNKINYLLFYITKRKFYHVPCFSFISFYFSNKIFFDRNITKFKKRLERLLIPYIIWPLLNFAFNNVLQKTKITFHQLKIQIIFGRQFMVPLWYLFSMIILSILYFILSNIFKKCFLSVVELLGIFCYIAQYSNYYKLLDGYNINVKLTILDTLSILPLTIIGLIFALYKIVGIFKANQKKAIFFSYLFIFLIFKYDIFLDLGGYNGVSNIFASIFFFVGFYLLPLENIYPLFRRMIKQITSHTNGIYCIQSKMISILKMNLHLEGTFSSCIIIYIISYFFSFFGTLIFGKTKMKYLFI